MSLQFPPYIILSIVAFFTALALAVLAYRRRTTTPGAWIFLMLMVGIALWAIANIGENISVELAPKLLWGSFSYVGVVSSIAAWALYVFHHTGHGKWITRRNLLLLSIEPVLMVLCVWTNSLHGLIWPTIDLQYVGVYTAMKTTWGAVFWIHAVYSLSLIHIWRCRR